MVQLSFQQRTVFYEIEDTINFQIDLKDSEIVADELININIDVFKLGEHRNEFVFGFASNPNSVDNKLLVSQKLPKSLIAGIYFINTIKVMYGEDLNGNQNHSNLIAGRDFELIFFEILNNRETTRTPIDIAKSVSEISRLRNLYLNKTITTRLVTDDTSCKEFCVIEFCIGCLIQNIIELDGYSIHPLKGGFSYSNMNDIVNGFLAIHLNTQIPFNAAIDEDFKRSTPLFAIIYKNVKAIDHIDALSHCEENSQLIYSILGFKKGQRPNTFAFIAKDKHDTGIFYNFKFPGYKGDILDGFSSTQTAIEIESLLPILNLDPWLRLLMDSLSNALNETNVDIKFFRLWAILELIAKKEITDNNIEITDPTNNPITNEKGNIKTKHALAKVYYYVFHCDFDKHNISSNMPGFIINLVFEMNKNVICEEGMEKITLWESMNIFYEIRNSTAHIGRFDIENALQGDWRQKLASKYYLLRFNTLIDYYEDLVKRIVSIQIIKTKKNFA